MKAGDTIPIVERTPDAVDLFLFSASAWLIHRIHYDQPFTTAHDGHPGLLIHGPLQGIYMVQTAQAALGRTARLVSVTYRHKAPAYLGDALRCGGEVTAADGSTVELELWVEKGDETVTTVGNARFEI